MHAGYKVHTEEGQERPKTAVPSRHGGSRFTYVRTYTRRIWTGQMRMIGRATGTEPMALTRWSPSLSRRLAAPSARCLNFRDVVQLTGALQDGGALALMLRRAHSLVSLQA